MPDLPVTFANVREWFPAPTAENALVGQESYWQMQSIGLLAALQILRIVPPGDSQQQALRALRFTIDTACRDLPTPTASESDLVLSRTLAPYVPLPESVVQAMLDLANVGPLDVVYDLGSGDVRIVFAAAKRGAWATGIEIDSTLVAACRAVAGTAAAFFVHGYIERTDFSGATVVTCYLLSRSMQTLAPRFRALKPGTRIVSAAFDIDGWEPTRKHLEGEVPLYLWVVP